MGTYEEKFGELANQRDAMPGNALLFDIRALLTEIRDALVPANKIPSSPRDAYATGGNIQTVKPGEYQIWNGDIMASGGSKEGIASVSIQGVEPSGCDCGTCDCG